MVSEIREESEGGKDGNSKKEEEVINRSAGKE